MENNERIKTQLQFKQHNEFFDDYFEIRKKAFSLLAQSITNNSLIPELYTTVLTLIDFTSNYIPRIEEVDTLMDEINILMANKRFNETKTKFRTILRLINDRHETTDILPQKADNYDKNEVFWRDEESKAMKEMKKAFYDVFMKK